MALGHRVSWISIWLALAACSPILGNPTGYTPIDTLWGDGYGYSDKPMGGAEFSVFAVGNPNTGAARVAEIALLRAAHLTLEQGHRRFLVLQGTAKTVTQDVLATVPIVLPGIFLPVPVAEQRAEERVAILVVRLLPRGAAVPPEALDAAVVVSYLGPRLDAE